jgi:hypothetical protein
VSFLIRWVLILLLFAFVVYVFKAIARFIFNLQGATRDIRKIREQKSGGAEMIRCAGCGAFVHALEAVTISKGKNRQSFCSRECLQSHMRISA